MRTAKSGLGREEGRKTMMEETRRDTSRLTDGMTDSSCMRKLYNKVAISETLERTKDTKTHTLRHTRSPIGAWVPSSRTEGGPKCAASCREIHQGAETQMR